MTHNQYKIAWYRFAVGLHLKERYINKQFLQNATSDACSSFAGGTFALYSLICRHAKASLIPNHQPEDREVSNYKLDIPSNQLRRAQMVKEKLESSTNAKMVLFIVTILGTSMVIGDGVLTPCISGQTLYQRILITFKVDRNMLNITFKVDRNTLTVWIQEFFKYY